MVNIYTLSDPRNNQIRYVGKTVLPLAERLQRHLRMDDKGKKVNWLKSLKNQDLKPTIELVDIVPEDDWRFEERFYISYFKFLGFNLTNLHEGGNGSRLGCKQSEETKQKKRESMRGWKPTKEHLAKANNARLAKPVSAETRKKMSEARKNWTMTEEHKRIISKRCKGIPLPDWHKKKLSEAKTFVVYQKDNSGNIINEFPSRKVAQELTGVNAATIFWAINNNKKTHGFYWEFKRPNKGVLKLD